MTFTPGPLRTALATITLAACVSVGSPGGGVTVVPSQSDPALEAQAQAALCVAGRACPTFLQLMGQSHMSEVYGINSGDRSISDPILRFVTAQ